MLKIAIIEDNLELAQLYRMKLESEGFTAEIAENGKLGLELCEQMKPDLVLLDLMMPEMSGPQMLEKMRAKPWGKDILVSIMTNLSQSEASMDMEKLGVHEYIVKAYYTPKQLVEEVKAILKRNKQPAQK